MSGSQFWEQQGAGGAPQEERQPELYRGYPTQPNHQPNHPPAPESFGDGATQNGGYPGSEPPAFPFPTQAPGGLTPPPAQHAYPAPPQEASLSQQEAYLAQQQAYLAGQQAYLAQQTPQYPAQYAAQPQYSAQQQGPYQAPPPGYAVGLYSQAPYNPAQYGQQVVAPKSPGIGLLASFFVPGLGTMINGDVGKGVGILVGYVVCLLLSFLILPLFGALGLWIWGMVDAYTGAQNWNRSHGIIS